MSGYVYRGKEPYVPQEPREPREPDAPRISRPPAILSPFDPSKCGERKGYAQHRRHKQEPCQPCRVANNAYQRAHKRKGRR